MQNIRTNKSNLTKKCLLFMMLKKVIKIDQNTSGKYVDNFRYFEYNVLMLNYVETSVVRSSITKCGC